MRIQLLGTGVPNPSTKRKGSSHMVEIGEDVILFDHGLGSFGRLLEAGKQPTDVTHLIFTHLHFDHCADYGALVLTRWDQGAGTIPELKVYGPAPVARMTDLLFAEDGYYGPDLMARTHMPGSLAFYQVRGGALPRRRPAPQVREIIAGDVIEGSDWRVSSITVQHAQPYLTCYAYRLECEDGIFVYSGDTGPIPAMVEFARGCDVLLHMCHYISGTLKPPMDVETLKSTTGHLELARIAQDAGAKTLVTTHITGSMDAPGIRERIVAEMSEVYKGNLFFGEDLLDVPVHGPEARRLD